MNTFFANSHQIEPELLRPTPRPLRNKKAETFLGCARIFLVPFILSGIGLFLMALVATGGVLYGQISGATGRNSNVTTALWGIPFFLWFFTLFWNGITGVFVWLFYVQPARERKLVESGAPTLGRITNKTTSKGEHGTSFFLHYEYSPIEYSMNGPKLQGNAFAPQISTFSSQPLALSFKGTAILGHQDYDAVAVGDSMTVLFDVNRPERSLLYRFAHWEVVA